MTAPRGLDGAHSVVARRDVHERCSASRLLLLPSSGDAVELNGPAALVWELLRQGVDMHGLVGRVAVTYGEDPATVTAAVGRTVEQLHSQGLVAPAE